MTRLTVLLESKMAKSFRMDVEGLETETIGGEPITRAEIVSSGYLYVAYLNTASADLTGWDFYDTNLARRYVRSKLDSFVPVMNELQLKAISLLNDLGPFVKKRERDAIVSNTAIEDWQDGFSIKRLEDAVETITLRSEDLLKIRPTASSTDTCDLSDDQIVAGIRYLTRNDEDLATQRNKRGWDAFDTKIGHWACYMLDTNRAAVIAAVRPFIGKYDQQLRKGGVL